MTVVTQLQHAQWHLDSIGAPTLAHVLLLFVSFLVASIIVSALQVTLPRNLDSFVTRNCDWIDQSA